MYIHYIKYIMNSKRVSSAIVPTNDFVFKKIFGKVGNESITKNLIQSITNDEIKIINLDGNTILDKDIITDKVGVLDVRATLNNNVEVDIEMQVSSRKNIEKRLLFYWSKLYSKTIMEGEDYIKSRRTIVIMIAEFELNMLKEIPKYHTKWKILETEFSKNVLTEDFEIDIIELPKVEKCLKENGDKSNKDLLLWTKFFTNPEALEEEEMKDNEEVKKATEELDEISQNEHDVWLAELRRTLARMDKKAELAYAIDEATDKGLKQGMEKGMKQGMKQGMKEGAKNKQIEIAKRMLEDNLNIDTIILYTGLTKKEIESIKKDK